MNRISKLKLDNYTIYCYTEKERVSAEKKLAGKSKKKLKVEITRFKGLGEMNPLQLRETTMAADTRRLVQLTIDAGDDTHQVMDMMLAKKRSTRLSL